MRVVCAFCLGILVAAIAWQVVSYHHLARRLNMRAGCSVTEIFEGNSTWCSGNVSFPPNRPRYVWNIDGNCVPPHLEGANSSIKVTATVQASAPACRLHLLLYDESAGTVVAEAETQITIKRLDTKPAPEAPPKSTPSPGPSARGRPPAKVPQNSQAQTTIDWPDPTIVNADSVVVEGVASGIDPRHTRVLLLTLTRDGRWINKGLIEIQVDGAWRGIMDLGLSYAVVLVKDSFTQPQKIHEVPVVGGDVLFVSRRNVKSKTIQKGDENERSSLSTNMGAVPGAPGVGPVVA
ncbi:MAG TPA: hypothetical protein VFF39_10400 [Verrucomicrobiae bacterium]|nr:hypothetical protein [Verrucomicrobiae bacterium]